MERVPRYTSYPTAPHFHNGVGEEEYIAWLATLEQSASLSLYFHIPYCQKLCWFCGCHTKIINHYEPVERYLEALEKEVRRVSSYIAPAPVTHIHFGGGSPTVLKAEDFTRFMALVREKFNVGAHADIAVEIDPRTVDGDKIAAYAKAGVTRASLGVQDFNPEVQAAINRIQPYDMVRQVIENLRAEGIGALNLDLIYGLPYQTDKTIRQTIEHTLTLEPARISLFGYAHVPWMKKHQQLIPEDVLPGKTERIAMFENASALLHQAGYIAIGLDHFAHPDDEMAKAARNNLLKRNFQGYTTDPADALIGMGISAISSLPQGYVQNTSQSIAYFQQVKAGNLPVVRGITLSEDDRERRDIIMSLMCRMQAGVDKRRYADELAWLQPFIDSGDANYTDGMLTVRPAARQQLRLIASAFDSYLTHSAARYSQAI